MSECILDDTFVCLLNVTFLSVFGSRVVDTFQNCHDTWSCKYWKGRCFGDRECRYLYSEVEFAFAAVGSFCVHQCDYWIIVLTTSVLIWTQELCILYFTLPLVFLQACSCSQSGWYAQRVRISFVFVLLLVLSIGVWYRDEGCVLRISGECEIKDHARLSAELQCAVYNWG